MITVTDIDGDGDDDDDDDDISDNITLLYIILFKLRSQPM